MSVQIKSNIKPIRHYDSNEQTSLIPTSTSKKNTNSVEAVYGVNFYNDIGEGVMNSNENKLCFIKWCKIFSMVVLILIFISVLAFIILYLCGINVFHK